MKTLNVERDVIIKALQRSGRPERPGTAPRTAYVHQDNFTIALISDTLLGLRVGVCKRRPDDDQDSDRALRIALSRAARSNPVAGGY